MFAKALVEQCAVVFFRQYISITVNMGYCCPYCPRQLNLSHWFLFVCFLFVLCVCFFKSNRMFEALRD